MWRRNINGLGHSGNLRSQASALKYFQLSSAFFRLIESAPGDPSQRQRTEPVEIFA
jgi:hypothetical protein